MAEQIKMLFGVNTPEGPWNIVLDVGPDPSLRGKGATFKYWEPLASPERLKLRDLKFCVHIEG